MTSTESRPDTPRGPRLEPFASFRYRGYPWLWAANLTSGAVLGAQGFLITWLVVEQLNRDFSHGLVTLAGALPALLLGLHAGRFADRRDRRLLLMGSHVAQAVVLLFTAIVAAGNLPSLGVIFVLVGLGAAAAALGQPVRLALIPAVVPRKRILNANALSDIGLVLGAFAGGLPAPFIADRWGIEFAFLMLASVLLIGALVLIPLRVPPRESEPEDGEGTATGVPAVTIGGGIGEAFRFLWGRTELRLLLVLLTVATVVGPWLALTFSEVEDQLDLTVWEWALLSLFLGVGTLVSVVVMAFIPRVRRAGLWYGVVLVVSALAAVGVWLSSSYGLTGFLMALFGIGVGVRGLLVVTLLQAHTPIAVMGRVMGVFVALTAATGLITLPITRAGQALLQHDGWVVFSALVLVGVVALVLWRSPRLRRMPSHPEPVPPANREEEGAPQPG